MAADQNNPATVSTEDSFVTSGDGGNGGLLSALVGSPDRYLWSLLGLLMSVTVFEAYDVTIFHLCTPDIARTFHLDDHSVGRMASFVRFGGMLAFFVVALSDRIGRKPIVSATVLLYAFFTFLTAISRGLWSFTLCQACAQIFLSAEFAVAIIMISEEFVDSARGRGVAMLHMVGLLGVVAGGELYGYMADSRFGWRGMYFIGIVPLLLVAVMRRNLRETRRFVRLEAEAAPRESFDPLGTIANALAAFRGVYRRRLLLIATLWNSVGLVGAPAVTFFSLYAKRDRHWTSPQIGHAIVIAYLLGTLGHAATGWMLDRFGRRPTACLTYVVGAFSILALFQTTAHGAMTLAFCMTVFAFQGSRTATATYSAELFPTEIRASAYGLTVQVFGQVAGLFTPYIVGSMSHAVGGLGNAVAIVSVGPLIGALVVLTLAPETRGRSLEDLAIAST